MEQKATSAHPTSGMDIFSKGLWWVTKGVLYWLESATSHNHKFNEADILTLKSRTLGYGIRPIAVVSGYRVKEDEFGKQGSYNVMMHKDSLGEFGEDFDRWRVNNEVPPGVERTVESHEFSKLLIERDFERRYRSLEDALVSYKSTEV